MRVTTIEQAQIPIGITFAMAQPPPEEAVAACHHIGAVLGAHQRRSNRRRKLCRHALVSVQTQYPVMRCLPDGEIFLCSETKPRLLDHSSAAAASNFYGIIVAAGIDHDLPGGKRARGQTTGELSARV